MKSKLVLHQRVRIFFCCSALALLLLHNESPAQDQRKPRPDPADAILKVQELPPALEKILVNWERESKKIKKLEKEILDGSKNPYQAASELIAHKS